jgi:hypothetical protein
MYYAMDSSFARQACSVASNSQTQKLFYPVHMSNCFVLHSYLCLTTLDISHIRGLGHIRNECFLLDDAEFKSCPVGMNGDYNRMELYLIGS